MEAKFFLRRSVAFLGLPYFCPPEEICGKPFKVSSNLSEHCAKILNE